MEVIQRVKGKTAAIAPSLPPGVTIKPFYDRSELIQRTLDTLKHALWEEIILVTPVIFTWLRERELRRALVTPPPALL